MLPPRSTLTAMFRAKLHLFVLCFIAIAGGCKSAAPIVIVDQRPDFIPRDQVASTRWVGDAGIDWEADDGTLTFTSGSAIAVGSNQLLTGLHVWIPNPEDDRWWEMDVPRKRDLSLINRFTCSSGHKHLRHMESTFRLVAAGEPNTVLTQDGDKPRFSSWDWVVIETDKPSWRLSDAAHVHPAAADTDWIVPEGTDLFVAGYSTIFKDAVVQETEDPGEEVRTDIPHLGYALFLHRGAYILRGKSVLINGDPAIEYTHDWPKPGGHSGGGVYLWNEAEKRLELIGVLNTWSPVWMNTKSQWDFSFLGRSLFTFDTTSKEYRQAVFYAPIASALAAIEAVAD